MWVASKFGFFSIVRKQDDNGDFYHIRARMPGDLENLRDAAGRADDAIHEWASTDYRLRILADEDAYADYAMALMQSVDYSNFKDRIHEDPEQSKKLDAYYQIWGVMEALQG